jgi:hypothetical protein
MHFRAAGVTLLAVILVGTPAVARGIEKSPEDNETAQIELKLGDGKAKTVSVVLEQSAIDVYNLCKPAKVYADDDPWLIAMGAGDGMYVFFFAAEGTPEEMRGRLDPRRDKLYAVLRYPTDSRDNGTFLLPSTMGDKTYGDFVTLKVPLGPDKAKAATVALGMSSEDVMRLFRPALDHTEKDYVILFDSIHDGGRYLLIFSPQDDSSTYDPKFDKLSQVMYWPGGQAESIFLLPRKKRGEPLPAKYRALLDDSRSDTGTDR